MIPPQSCVRKLCCGCHGSGAPPFCDAAGSPEAWAVGQGWPGCWQHGYPVPVCPGAPRAARLSPCLPCPVCSALTECHGDRMRPWAGGSARRSWGPARLWRGAGVGGLGHCISRVRPHRRGLVRSSGGREARGGLHTVGTSCPRRAQRCWRLRLVGCRPDKINA